ncbi:G2/mitotic-specific cyclin-B [Caenorhabditis elegans]|uniref:G2/mitotic-specific cyclin-B n=1 Tax=Caenorhabditis elegans TaxID=6239 RepID=O45926_CAEEL|nr:Cyclin N-terminal domain-containing protein [Caenorhabditis elegans]CAA15975.2 Cyclin N-terminal domain-containing protein [Caenorhabditis elegans]|eukprot:NP_502047.1 CYclin B [Caenorhabditis elegans]
MLRVTTSIRKTTKNAVGPRTNLEEVLNCIAMAEDIYNYLVHHEKKYVLDDSFINGGNVNSKMRRILVDWLIQVHLRFHLTPETLHLTIFVLDRIIVKNIVSKAEFQLLGVAALFVASKFEDIYLPDILEYEMITDNTFSKKQIMAMEQTILNALNFDLSCPSSLVFLRCISKTLTENDVNPIDKEAFYYVHNISKCLGELALLDSVMSTVPRSHVASASMIITLNVITVDGINPKTAASMIRKQLGASKQDIYDAIALLAQVAYKNFRHQKLCAIREKYQSSKFGRVSYLMTDEILEKIHRMGRNVEASEAETSEME